MNSVPSDELASRERNFYSRMALLLAALVLLGFGPSFYLKGLVPPYPRPNPTLPPAVLLHGALFTLWMLAVVVQTQLVARGRRDLHLALGGATLILAAAIVPTMYVITVGQVARATQPPFTDPLSWTIVPLAAIPAFAWLIWSGWHRRREPQWHKRAMLSAAIVSMMGPAIGRLPLAPPTLGGNAFLSFLGLTLFIPLVVWDRKSIGKTHPATRMGIALAGASVLVPQLIFWTGADWASIARRLPGV